MNPDLTNPTLLDETQRTELMPSLRGHSVTLNQRLSEYEPDSQFLVEKFRSHHVEALLNQAADLADKCLEEYKDLCSYQAAGSQLELDVIERATIYDLDKERKDALGRNITDVKARQKALEDTSASMTAVKVETQRAVDSKSAFVFLDRIRNDILHYEKEAEAVFRTEEVASLTRQLEWAEADKEYALTRLDERGKAIERIKREMTDGWALDYSIRIRLVATLFERNFEDMYNRIQVAQVGLHAIYGQVIELEKADHVNYPGYAIIFPYANWVRKALEWLAAYQQLDQSFTQILSIRAIIGENEWLSLMTAEDERKLSFYLPAEQFHEHENVRVRGLSASLLGSTGSVPWSLRATLPRQATYVREGKKVDVDQDTNSFPSCILGRIENRNSTRGVEVAGMVSLMNGSPISRQLENESYTEDSEWILTLRRPKNTNEKFQDLTDLLLELSLVGQPVFGRASK